MRAILWVAGVMLMWPVPVLAQDAALDDKLRDLLHQTTTELRASEDAASTLQTQLDAMTHQRDDLQAQLTAAQAKAAAPSVTPQQLAALQQAQGGLAAARARTAALAANGAKLQAAYQQAVAVAQDRDAADKHDAGALKAASGTLGVCTQENARLIDLSGEILHLYETPKFNALLVANHERLIGFKRVELENLVQDYEDKIAAQSYVGP